LSCDEICVQETGEAELALGNDSHSAAVLEPFIERLPRPGDDISVERVGQTALVLARSQGVMLREYFPLAPFRLDETAPTSLPQQDGSLRVQLGNTHQVHGVVRAQVRGKTTYFGIEEARDSVERAEPQAQ
jgi:hypothetical protein